MIRVQRAAKKWHAAKAELDAAIQDAHPVESLRKIAAATGLNHETVRKIVRAAPNC